MDKNQITGLVLISLLLFIYIFYFAPKPSETTSTPVPEMVPEEPETTTAPSRPQTQIAIDTTATGFSSAIGHSLSVEEKPYFIETDLAEYTFSSKGGQIKDVVLKNYLTSSKETLHLIDENSSYISEILHTRYGDLNISELHFRMMGRPSSVSGKDSLTIEFIADFTPGVFIKRTYLLKGDSYVISQVTSISGMENELVNKNIDLSWEYNIRNTEMDLKTSQQKTTITYYTLSGSFDDLKETSTSREETSVAEPVKWISFKQKFFTAGMISRAGFNHAEVMTEPVTDPEIVKYGLIKTTSSLENYQQGIDFFFGPNNYQILKKVTDGFSKNIYLGWPPVNFVNKWLIIPIFNFLERYISSYGIIIMFLVIIVKIILFPLTYNSYISMAKTKVLKPQLDAIKAEHGEDMQKVQSEQMKLYQQVGINPLSGCIPVLLQMPILFSMFYFFPNSIELRQESFLWAHDLSTYDSVLTLPFHLPGYGNHISLFTILMTASTILYTWSTSQLSSVTGPMKTLQYVMPLIFMFVLNSFPAALTFYYFISNIITFGQQALIRYFVDEEKIKRVLEENKKKNATKKKSSFQSRLEDAMKAADEKKKKKK